MAQGLFPSPIHHGLSHRMYYIDDTASALGYNRVSLLSKRMIFCLRSSFMLLSLWTV